MTKTFRYNKPFKLESGAVLNSLHLAYTTHGKLSEEKDNVVWICHALTANADPAEWWPGVIGENAVIDPKNYFIVCANIIGSCYGSSGPMSINPATSKPYYNSFPAITIRDMVKAHILL